MPPEHKPNDRVPDDRWTEASRPGPAAPTTGKAGPARRKMRRAARIRVLLIGLSLAGIVLAAGLWAAGHGPLGARVLAGDVLLIVVLTLLAA
jgi:hypothetical protein